MSTLSEIRDNFALLHKSTKNTISLRNFQSQWNDLFGTSISPEDSEYFLQYYREMKNTRARKQRARKTYKGGRRTNRRTSSRRMSRRMNRRMSRSMSRRVYGGFALTGAPLNYSMVPGTTADVYGKFPTDISTDPQSIQNLDQFYASALTRGCGVENITREVPATMGSNQIAKVGGRRKTRRGYKSRGGNLLDTISTSVGTRLFYPTPPPNFIQTTSASAAGELPFPSSDPTKPSWNYSVPPGTIIQPSMITSVKPEFTHLARPVPYVAGNTGTPAASTTPAASAASASAASGMSV